MCVRVAWQVSPDVLASECQRKFACSCTVNDLPGKGQGQEVIIQVRAPLAHGEPAHRRGPLRLPHSRVRGPAMTARAVPNLALVCPPACAARRASGSTRWPPSSPRSPSSSPSATSLQSERALPSSWGSVARARVACALSTLCVACRQALPCGAASARRERGRLHQWTGAAQAALGQCVPRCRLESESPKGEAASAGQQPCAQAQSASNLGVSCPTR